MLVKTYAQKCGPAALDALLGRHDRVACAQLLRDIAAEFGRPDWITDEGATTPAAMLAGLRRVGLVAEPLDPRTGEPSEPAELHFARELARPPATEPAEAMAREVIDAAPIAQRAALWARYHDGVDDTPTVQQVIWRLPRATLLIVALTRGSTNHAIAVRFARCIAGDTPGLDHYAGSRVARAYRITRASA